MRCAFCGAELFLVDDEQITVDEYMNAVCSWRSGTLPHVPANDEPPNGGRLRGGRWE